MMECLQVMYEGTVIISADFLEKLEPWVALVIVTNSITIGIETDYPSFIGWNWIEAAFLVFFIAEISIRMACSGCKDYFWGSDFRWNWYDVIALAANLIQFFVTLWVEADNADLLYLLRMARLAKLSKLFRLFRLQQTKELTLMIDGLIKGMRTLFSAIVLLSFMVYVWASV